MISSYSSYNRVVRYGILYWYPPSFTLRFSSILGPMVILVGILFYEKKKLSPSTGYYHLPSSNLQGPLCGFSLCCLQGSKYVLFFSSRNLFVIVIPVALTRCQLRSARFTLLDFCVPICACRYSFFSVF